MNLDVMLASSGNWDDATFKTLEESHWFDLKWDGVRSLALIDHGKVQLINRNKVDITHRYPDVVEVLRSELPNARLILDGELVVVPEGEFYKSDFKALSRRDRQSDPVKINALAGHVPVTYVSFDLLMEDDRDLRDLPLHERLTHLRDAVRDTDQARVRTSAIYSSASHPRELVERMQLEGLIAKSVTSTYRHGRQKSWVKLKPTHSDTFVVLGLESGTGYRADTFGALLLGQQTPLGFEYVGKVGSGFTEADLQEIVSLWGMIQSGARTEPIVVEVQYQEITVDGALRFPVFRGIRTDVDANL